MDVLKIYRRDIDRFDRNFVSVERDAVERLAQGDESARWDLVVNSLPFAMKTAYRFRWSTKFTQIGLSDLVQEANFGSIIAASKFDPTRETKFLTYAGYWMAQCVRRFIYANLSTIYVPISAIELQKRHAVLPKNSARNSYRELVDSLALDDRTQSRLDDAERALKTTKMVCKEDGRVIPVRDFSFEHAEAMRETFEFSRFVESICVNVMSERDMRVLRLRCKGSTLNEIGLMFGVTRERIRQIEARAIRKAKEACERYHDEAMELFAKLG